MAGPNQTDAAWLGGATDAVLITPSDAADLPVWPRNIQITGDGALHVTTAAGSDVTFPSGTFNLKTPIPLCVRRVWATGTTATGVIGWL